MAIQHIAFGRTASGEPVEQFTLTNANGLAVSIITYGATITRLLTLDRHNQLGDIVLGHDTLAGYEQHSPYFGCVVGRVGNRIAGGNFSVDGLAYQLATNNGPNHLHGGVRGYDKRVWQAQAMPESAEGSSVRFKLEDPDGTEGYPGTVDVAVIYTLTANNGLMIDYTATTDAATPINLTQHTYFNLRDAGASAIEGHMMQIHADAYTPVDATLIPKGEIALVARTPLDFRSPKPIGQDLRRTGLEPVGYDHNFVFRNDGGRYMRAATVREPESGRTMEVWTTQPGMQFYSGNFLNGSIRGKSGVVYEQYAGFCLETQHYPDSVHHPNFPSMLLRPGGLYRQRTEYRFGNLSR